MQDELTIGSIITKNKRFNLLLFCWLIFLFLIVYIVSPSLINFFTAVLTIFLLLSLNAVYFICVALLAIFMRKGKLKLSDTYFARNFFRINVVFSFIISIGFIIALMIPKFI
ncbi:MAG TPA: hypothetical protein DCQ26_05070 [Marinilabiliales bacterium]|nr:hypothetical protein [Marinilabiliales bacterium]HBY52237.1 hypothetical protein [Marinilabiliales bacterium]